MHKAIRLVLGAVGLVGAAGCSSDRALPVSSTVVASTRALDSDTRSGGLAASMARALAEASVRHAVLQALRSSPWVEHKLVLQEFVLTSAGSHFVAAVARAQGVSEREIRSQIAALPALDFYVPSREERLTWRGEDVVRVAIATSTAAPAVAFRPDGSAVPFLSAHAPGSVLLLLHPAEPKGRRMKQQAARVGATIQDADDGDVSVQFVHRPATGDSAVYDIVFAPDGRWMTLRPDGTVSEELYAAVQRHSVTAQLRQVGADAQPQIECGEVIVCDGDEPQPPPPPPPPPGPPTGVYQIRTRSVCDMDCSAGNEFEFRASAYSTATNALVLQGTARITGVPSGNFDIGGANWLRPFGSQGLVPMIFTTVDAGVYIDVNIVETDTWPNPDDNFDPNPILRLASDKFRQYHAGDFRNPSQFCVRGETECREVTVQFEW